ncbi:hypothetical protein, partial [Haloplanus natans]|uniref:hypothetical protein n=1 Tax=Haloplanus natans TaxID=376171 RepID=UPI001B7F9A9D
NGALTVAFAEASTGPTRAEQRQRIARQVASGREDVSPADVTVTSTASGFQATINGDGERRTVITGAPDPDRGAPTTEFRQGETAERGVGITRGPEGASVVFPRTTAADVTRYGQRQLDAQGGASRGEIRAAVNRFGQRQLEATDPSEQFGDVAVYNPFTTRGTADGEPASLSPTAALAVDPLVGDPGEDPRTEEQLQDAAAGFDETISAGVEAASRGAPGSGALLGTVGGVARLERAAQLIATRTGLVEGRNLPAEGPFERDAEAAAEAFLGVANAPSAVAEGKEIIEFAATQPPRVLDTVDAAATDRREESPLPGVAGDAVDAGERASTTEFVQDVEQRGGRVAASARESFRDDPSEFVARGAAGLVAGAAAGSALGRVATRLPGVSGSDLSGRVLLKGERALRRGRRFASDRRARGDLTFGGGRSDTTTIGADDLVSERATADPEGEGQLASPPDDLTGGARSRQRAGLNQQGAFVGSNTRQQDAAFGGTGKPDTGFGEPSDRDFSTAVDRAFGRLDGSEDSGAASRRVAAQRRSVDAETASPARGGLAADVGAAGAGATGGLLAGAFGRQEAAQASSVFGGDAAFGPEFATDTRSGADVRSGLFTGGLSDTDTAARVDVRADARVDVTADARLGARGDTRLDLRREIQQDTRVDTRLDLRQDVRQDVREDTRQDTRVDTRFDFNRDRRRDDLFRPDPERDGEDAAAGETGDQGRYVYSTPSLF